MEFKGTKGPWSCHKRPNEDSDIPFAIQIDYNSACLPIADVCSNPNNAEVIAANAQLIAAAPELLEALSDLIDWCKDNRIEGNKVIYKAQNALLKATT